VLVVPVRELLVLQGCGPAPAEGREGAARLPDLQGHWEAAADRPEGVESVQEGEGMMAVLSDKAPPTAVELAAGGLSGVLAVATIVEAIAYPGMWFEWAIAPVGAGLIWSVLTFGSWLAMRDSGVDELPPVPPRRELARRGPIRVVASSGRRELPSSAERVG